MALAGATKGLVGSNMAASGLSVVNPSGFQLSVFAPLESGGLLIGSSPEDYRPVELTAGLVFTFSRIFLYRGIEFECWGGQD